MAHFPKLNYYEPFLWIEFCVPVMLVWWEIPFQSSVGFPPSHPQGPRTLPRAVHGVCRIPGIWCQSTLVTAESLWVTAHKSLTNSQLHWLCTKLVQGFLLGGPMATILPPEMGRTAISPRKGPAPPRHYQQQRSLCIVALLALFPPPMLPSHPMLTSQSPGFQAKAGWLACCRHLLLPAWPQVTRSWSHPERCRGRGEGGERCREPGTKNSRLLTSSPRAQTTQIKIAIDSPDVLHISRCLSNTQWLMVEHLLNGG